MSFYFYDLETSGRNPKTGRIMQFAGQRLDDNLKPIANPHNFLIKITPDVLPEPEAILITGITPQQTIEEGISEFDFLKIFYEQIALPGTTFVGYNSVRFDDEFIRYLNYRNFYDPYEWTWRDQRSRWDLLDLTRMTRALRPEGLNWPFDSRGQPTNTLQLMAELNNLNHSNAHDALSDVEATIDLARLIKNKQPKLFEFLLNMRGKKAVKSLVEKNRPFVYSSGRYQFEVEKTAVVKMFSKNPDSQDAAFVFDLRFDPKVLLNKTAVELAKNWQLKSSDREFHVPVKTIKYNRCPAVAPVSVLTETNKARLMIDDHTIQKNSQAVEKHATKLSQLVAEAVKIVDQARQEKMFDTEIDVDSQLYNGFFSDRDKKVMNKVRQADPSKISPEAFKFEDQRLNLLLPLYKARNFSQYLTDDEIRGWEAFRKNKLLDRSGGWLNKYLGQIDKIASQPNLNSRTTYLLEELRLYAQSLLQ